MTKYTDPLYNIKEYYLGTALCFIGGVAVGLVLGKVFL